MSKDSVLALSGDPGSKNFAIALTRGKLVKGKLKIKLLGTGMLPEEARLYDLVSGVSEKLRGFRRVLKNLEAEHGKPDVACFERFQTRGILGKTIECISMQNSVPALVYPKIKPRFITAATWKNRANKQFDLKASYRAYGLLSQAKAYTGKRDHELDANLIGIYMLCKHFGVPDFELFEDDKFDDFMQVWLDCPKLNLTARKL